MTVNTKNSAHLVLPSSGLIDLSVHDLPHNHSHVEWWYFHGHIESTSGKPFAFFASFFRIAENKGVLPFEFCHSLSWALIDLEEKKYVAEVTHDENIVSKIVSIFDNRKEKLYPMDKALKEMVNKGKLPAPDYKMKTQVEVDPNELNLMYDNNSIQKNSKGHYVLNLNDQLGNVNISLVLKPLKNPVRHGKNGVVKSSLNNGEDMFYYFIPENDIDGSITYNNEKFEVKGSGWYDHEFNNPYTKADSAFLKDKHWVWFAIQLDNHCQLTAYHLVDKKTGDSNQLCVWIDENGKSLTLEENITITTLDRHISKKTCVNYPIAWKIQIPDLELELHLEADFPQQEVVTILSAPGFWEGRVKATGTLAKQEISGNAFVEVTAEKGWENLDKLFDHASEEILKVVQNVIPTSDEAGKINLMMTDRNSSYLKALPHTTLHEALIEPLKEMIDRKGKSWRSHLLRLLAGLSGGNPYEYDSFVALGQILHCSSMIIDDVQDQSPMRRGGPSCHEMYGIATAINSGCFGYFVGEKTIRKEELSDTQKKQIYEVYFDGMRLSHAGQALDIRTGNDQLQIAFDSGNAKALEDYIMEVHTLKTGTPIKMIAHIVAIIEKLNNDETNALCSYVEAFGLAYQIIDDVRDFDGSLSGSKDNLEDLREGKPTLPVAYAIKNTSHENLQKIKILWNKPNKSAEEVNLIAQWVINSGSLETCKKKAFELLENAWVNLDELFPDSHYKLMIRSLSDYFLSKHKK